MNISDRLRNLVAGLHQPAEAPPRQDVPPAGESAGDSAHCANGFGGPRNQEIPPVPLEVAVLGFDAVEHFLDRLGRADELEMDTTPGSPAWEVALREARRVGAGLPPHHDRERGPDALDIAMELFTPPDGRMTVRPLTAKEVAELGIKKTT